MDFGGPYIVVGGESIEALITRVNKYIAQGYRPLGGISVTSRTFMSRGEWEEELLFAQALMLAMPQGL